MRRFHVHVSVTDLVDSIAFYGKLFGQAPTKVRPDYAKWMLDDPRVNFAISARGHEAGVNHFGFQVDSAEELEILMQLADTATGGQVLGQGEAAYCYAKSEKHWTVDPQGLAWEHFYTIADAEVFGADAVSQSNACCIPVRSSVQDKEQAKGVCCIPNIETAAGSCCS